MKNTIVGIIAIIVAIIMITAPVVGLATLGLISGLSILGMAIWVATLGFSERISNDLSLFPSTVGIVRIIMGITFLCNTSWLINLGLWAYIITGILLLITGIIALLVGERKTYKMYAGIFGLLFGFLFIIVGFYNLNPNILGFITGIGILVYGILNIRE